MRTIYVVGGDEDYANWMQGTCVKEMWQAELVVFTGGEDVSPELYSEPRHPLTSCNFQRDQKELKAYTEARKMGKKMVGICRGAQFLCVMAGGKLVQHQENPTRVHGMTTYDGDNIHVTSTHHQAQYPWLMDKKDYRVLGWTQGVSTIHLDGKQKEIVMGYVDGGKEVEICHYPNAMSLGIQPHPEMMLSLYDASETYKKSIVYFRKLLDKFLREFPTHSL